MAIKHRPANRIQQFDQWLDDWTRDHAKPIWRLNHWFINRPRSGEPQSNAFIYALIAFALIALILSFLG